ncbi:MAG TPA: helix-hairpin-helix domain-containing protein [bacterium]|nr:helix-hairpin-helix domain-containing protein [bacterium]
MDNREIASVIERLGTASELLGENPFKARAYHGAARTLHGLAEPAEKLLAEGRLGELPGFGKALVEKVAALVATGRLPQLEERLAKLPSGLFEMLEIEGLGAKRVKLLWETLGTTNPGELEYACLENRLVELPGFGPKIQANVLAGIGRLNRYRERRLYPEARALADDLHGKISDLPGVERCAVAGSIRRLAETAGDVDLLVRLASGEKEVFTDALRGTDWADGLRTGDEGGLRFDYLGTEVDLRNSEVGRWGTHLVLATGSAAHVDGLRGLARERGLDLDALELDDEGEVYRALGLDFVPPELREGLGEIEAAARGNLPKLLETADIRGVFHVHTTASDGTQSLEELAKLGGELGYAYIGVSDHSRSAFYAGGLSVEDLAAQADRIARLNDRGRPCRLLAGIESDILADGSLDYPEEILGRLDFVIASVHAGLRMPREKATARVLAAIENPFTTMLGHATGRLLLAREGYELDWDRVLAALTERGVALELNTSPHRFDADWRVLRRARELGIPVALNPDAHRAEMFDTVALGVGIARKAWLTAADVLNTRELPDLSDWLAARRGERNR